MPPKTSSQELVPPDISYTIVDTITSLSGPLAEAEILVKNVCFLQCIDMKKETGFACMICAEKSNDNLVGFS